MKFSNAVSFLSVVVISTMAQVVSGSVYECSIEVKYSGSSNTEPNYAEKGWYTAKTMSVYSDTHTNSDFSMTGIDFNTWEAILQNEQPSSSSTIVEDNSAAGNLRGGGQDDEIEEKNNKQDMMETNKNVEIDDNWWLYAFYRGTYHCELCLTWDDDQVWIGDGEEEDDENQVDPVITYLESGVTQAHVDWENQLCTELHNSLYSVYNPAFNCEIKRNNCVHVASKKSEEEEEDLEEGGDNKDEGEDNKKKTIQLSTDDSTSTSSTFGAAVAAVGKALFA